MSSTRLKLRVPPNGPSKISKLGTVEVSASRLSGNAFVSRRGGQRVKSHTVLPMARHRCDISSKGAVLPGRNDVEKGPANSLYTSVYHSKYNKRFDFKPLK